MVIADPFLRLNRKTPKKLFQRENFLRQFRKAHHRHQRYPHEFHPPLETDDVGSFGGREFFLMLADFRSSQRSVRETGEVIISFRKELGKDRRIGLTPLFRGGEPSSRENPSFLHDLASEIALTLQDTRLHLGKITDEHSSDRYQTLSLITELTRNLPY